VKAAIEADCAPVLVVTGEDSAQIASELTRFTVTIEMNPDWQSRVGSSIVVGIRYAMNLAPDLDAAVLFTCDQPFGKCGRSHAAHAISPNNWQGDRRVCLRLDPRNFRSL
jgi:CTP:molybdopterin cytidylyltransferase MocA